MEPVLLLALVNRQIDELRQAFPNAPVIPHKTPARLTTTRTAAARLLQGLAARVDPTHS
jgi:hypothetical protein